MGEALYNLMLADDDLDDCLLFKDVLKELPIPCELTTVHDGVELMHYLNTEPRHLPDVLFLDLNMPRKTGFECLSEIKLNDKLKDLPIIIFSTSMDNNMVNLLFDNGANYYIQKPGDFSELKKVVYNGIKITTQKNALPPTREKFIIQP